MVTGNNDPSSVPVERFDGSQHSESQTPVVPFTREDFEAKQFADNSSPTEMVSETTDKLLRVDADACVAEWISSKAELARARVELEKSKDRVSKQTQRLKDTVDRLTLLVNKDHQRRFVMSNGKLVSIQHRKNRPAYVREEEIGGSVSSK